MAALTCRLHGFEVLFSDRPMRPILRLGCGAHALESAFSARGDYLKGPGAHLEHLSFGAPPGRPAVVIAFSLPALQAPTLVAASPSNSRAQIGGRGSGS